MSITETKFRKGFIETPELRTDNINYLGFDYPMYDVVTKTFIPNTDEYEEEFCQSSGYQDKEVEIIRCLPHSPLVKNTGLITLRGISLYTCNRNSTTLEYIVLCVYCKKGTNYEYLGHSINAFINPIRETVVDFDFDLNLFQEVNGVQVPYTEVYLRPYKVQFDETTNTFVLDENSKHWDSLVNKTSLTLKVCNKSSLNYSAFITDFNGESSPHVLFRYRTGNYAINDKIAHTANGDVHINSYEKEKIEELYELTTRVFNEDEIITSEHNINTRELNSAYSSTGGEIMCAFTVVPTDFIGHEVTELKFRCGSFNNSDASNKKMNNMYLQADCFNSSGTRVATFFSIEPKSQTQQNEEIVFNFTDFVIKDNYAKIEFRTSPSNTERQDEIYYSFWGSSLRNSLNQCYRAKDGWILKWLHGAPVSNIPQTEGGQITAPQTQNGLTPDFTITFYKVFAVKGTGIVKHMTNDFIHLSEEDRNEIAKIGEVESTLNDHIGDDSHLTEEDKERISNIANLQTRVSNIETSIGDNGSIAQNLEQVTGLITTHTNDDESHLNDDDRLKLMTVSNNINVTEKAFSTLRDGLYERPDGKTSVKSFQLSKKHFTTGSVTEISIPYKGANNVTGYLCAQIFYRGESDDNVKEASDCIYSILPQTQNGDGEVTFKFNNFLLPEDYRFVRFMMVENETKVPNGKTGTNCLTNFRIKVLSSSSTSNAFGVDDDECKVFSTATEDGWLAYVNAKVVTSVLDKLNSIEQNNVLLQTEKDFLNNCLTPRTRDVVFNTQHNGYIMVGADGPTVNCIQYSREHFISGKIKKFEFPWKRDDSLKGGYLCVQIFGQDETEDTVKTLDDCYFSELPQSYVTDSTNSSGNKAIGRFRYTFDNLVLPDDYKFIRIMQVDSREIVPNGKTGTNCNPMRVRQLVSSNNISFDEFDDDLCKVYTGDNAERNIYIISETTYEKEFENEITEKNFIIEQLLGYISQLQTEIYVQKR